MSQITLNRSPYYQLAAKRRQGLRILWPSSYKSSGYSNSLIVGRLGARRMNFKFAFVPIHLIIGLLLVVALMSFLYLAHFNQVATKGYELKRLEVDRQNLLEQYQIKNMHLTRIKSLSAISQSARAQKMLKAGELTFVRGETALASVDQIPNSRQILGGN